MAAKNIFFLGKGGTGKTTVSILTALSLARSTKKVSLISLDPAHNLFDALEIRSSKSVQKLSENLQVVEIDVNFWLKKYLDAIEDQVTRTYRYLTSLGLEKHLQVLRYSPGMEEYALIYAFQSMQKKYQKLDYLIFDMPPTGLALRFFNLPGLSLIWLDKLIRIRRQILEKKQIINTVKESRESSSADKVLDRLLALQNSFTVLDSLLKNKTITQIHVVMNDDKLSLSESLDIRASLNRQKMKVDHYILNKSEARSDSSKHLASGIRPVTTFPKSATQLSGLKILADYSQQSAFKKYIEDSM